MQHPDCIREASRACFNTCCLHPPEDTQAGSSAVVITPRHGFVSAILYSIQAGANFTNHESLPSLRDLFCSLTAALPCYAKTALADEIRSKEYAHLSLLNRICLDYIGSGLCSYSQLAVPLPETASTSSAVSALAFSPSAGDAPFFEISYNTVNLSSYLRYGTHESEFQVTTRGRIAKYMNLFEEDYSIVFTANQVSAFKLLADSYPFDSKRSILTVYDYENEAIQEMNNAAKKQGAGVQSGVFSWPNFRVNSKKLRKLIVNKGRTRNRGLFVFPLQSRMSGARYSYQWMNLARDNGWHVLIDACAFGAKEMETLGLSLFQPDFLICSFFKVFGLNPSGFCCLFIKKSRVSELAQSSTTMGIVSIIPATDNTPESKEIKIIDKNKLPVSEITEIHRPEPELRKNDNENTKSRIEFRGLDHAEKLGLILISSRARILTNWLVNALLSLRHPHSGNGLTLIRIYGPKIKVDRGPAIAFNVYDWKGERIDPNLVQKLADRSNISLSCGFLNNVCLAKNSEQQKEKLLEIRNPEEKRRGKQVWGLWVASISIGMLSNFEDVYRVWGFLSRFLDADFVEKERWRYTAINQTTVEI